MIKVIKRNGEKVNYNGDKIILAISKAMVDVKMLNLDIANAIEVSIYRTLMDNNIEEIDIEDIQDMVEEALIENAMVKTAKAYIIYRAKKTKDRKSEPQEQYGILSKAFLSRYKHLEPPMTDLGASVYYRTYSRSLPEKGRREYWWETVRRAVEYNTSLIPTSKQEAEELFDNIFHLRQFLSGRTLYTGGTPISIKYPMANYNCSFQIVNDIEAFKDIFYLLMIGSGAGVRVRKEDVKKLPRFRTNVDVVPMVYKPLEKNKRQESTALTFRAKNIAEVIVGDSKEGWVQSLDFFLKLLTSHEYRHIDTILLDFNSVRPKGERLKTFGGTASGPEALVNIFIKIDKLLEKHQSEPYYRMKSIDALDIANIIGEGVVVGGVRRTSEIVLFDADDIEVEEAKSKLYIQKDGNWLVNQDIIHRKMSNNTIFYREKPSRAKWSEHLKKMRYSGEPGVANEVAGLKRRRNFHGLNPCGEILLNNKGLCNLTTINVMAFVEDGILNIEKLLQAQRLSARASYRMTNVELELPKWDEVQKEERLAGVSLTGWQDMVNATKLSMDDQKKLLAEMRRVAKEETKKLSLQIGANDSLLVTTVKPEGTLSQLPTVSSGLHYSHSPYYIRRVRINSHDPIVKALEKLNYPIFPEDGQTVENCTTKVIEFPVKAPMGRTKYDVSAIEQLENYKMFMEYYVDHNASITIHVRDNEWELVEQWVWDNWDDVVAVSFLPLDDSFYALLPYEAIDEEDYNRRVAECGTVRLTPELISEFEVFGVEFELDEGCDTGACPVR